MILYWQSPPEYFLSMISLVTQEPPPHAIATNENDSLQSHASPRVVLAIARLDTIPPTAPAKRHATLPMKTFATRHAFC